MHSFFVNIHTVQEIQSFIDLACGFPFEITVSDGMRSFNAKSLMGYCCLDPAHPMKVTADCTQEEFDRFRSAVSHFCSN